MVDIPSKEPTEITAGDTVKWTKSLSDYKASDSWVLTYYLKGNGISATITTIASGDDHAVTITAATSAAWASGDAWLDGYVAKAGERYRIYSAKLTIKPDLATADGTYDGRSTAKQALDAIETAITALVAGAQSYSLTVGGVSRTVTNQDLAKLIDQRNILRGDVKSEEMAEALANGLDINPRNIGIRFNRP